MVAALRRSCIYLFMFGMVALASSADVISVNGNYQNTYRLVSPPTTTDFLTWDAARSLCAQQGSGWGMASVITESDMTAVKSMVYTTDPADQRDVWLGGYTSDVFTGNWLWADGRFKNVRFFTKARGSTTVATYGYPTFWDDGEPSYYRCTTTNTYEHQLTLSKPNYNWNDFLPNSCPVYSYPGGQVICERSACTVAADCTSGKTDGITGTQYAPSCVCSCKAGSTGPRCEMSSSAPSSLLRQFRGGCSQDAITWTAANTACRSSFGSAWSLATISNSDENSIVASMCTTSAVWLGASYGSEASDSALRWKFGRLAGSVISNGFRGGSFSPTTLYNDFQSADPIRTHCSGDTQQYLRRMSGSSQTWQIAGTSGCDNEKSSLTFCYVCSRDLCQLSDANCNSKGTSSMAGQYPSCACVCRPLYYGPQCIRTPTPTVTLTQCETLSTRLTTTKTLPQTLTHGYTISASVSKSSTSTATYSARATVSGAATASMSLQHTQSAPSTQSKTMSITLTAHTSTITSLVTVSLSATESHSASTTWSPTTTWSESISRSDSLTDISPSRSYASRTATTTTSTSSSKSTTVSGSNSVPSPSGTPSATFTVSETVSRTLSTSSTRTLTLTASSTQTTSPSLISVSASASLELSSSTTRTPSPFSISSSHTVSESHSVSFSDTLCEYVGGNDTAVAPCSVLGRGALSFNSSAPEEDVVCDEVEHANTNVTTVEVPYAVWGGGDVFQVRFPVGAAFGLAVIPDARGGGDGTNNWNADVVHFELWGSRRATGTTQASLTVNVSYTGYETLAAVETRLWLPVRSFIRCDILVSSGAFNSTTAIPIDFVLQAGPSVSVPSIGDVATGVAVGGSVLTGSPGALVRASMLASLESMMRCSEFDPEAEVQWLNNPPMWALGPAVLQYQRGSLVISSVSLVVLVCVLGVLLGMIRGFGEGITSWADAITALRLPSVALVVVSFVGEMSVSSASSSMFYSHTGNLAPLDYILSVVCVCTLWAYIGLYAYQVTVGMRVDVVPIGTRGLTVVEDTDLLAEMAPNRERAKKRNPWRAVLRYALEPTHDPCVRGHGVNGVVENGDLVAGELWLRRNYYFVADRRWALYGAIEVFVGSIVDVIDGIPMSTRDPKLCVGRPAAMAALLAVLLGLLLWRVPYSVRLQHWTALIVVGMLFVSSIFVSVNVLLVSSTVDDISSILISAAGIIVSIFSAIDGMLVLMTLAPVFRRFFGLQATSLIGSLQGLRNRALFLKEHSKSNKNIENVEGGAAEPLLVDLVSPGSERASLDGDEMVSRTDDEGSIQRMILEDIEHYENTKQLLDDEGSGKKSTSPSPQQSPTPQHSFVLQAKKPQNNKPFNVSIPNVSFVLSAVQNVRDSRSPLDREMDSTNFDDALNASFSSLRHSDDMTLKFKPHRKNNSFGSFRLSVGGFYDGTGSVRSHNDSVASTYDSIASLVQAEERKRLHFAAKKLSFNRIKDSTLASLVESPPSPLPRPTGAGNVSFQFGSSAPSEGAADEGLAVSEARAPTSYKKRNSWHTSKHAFARRFGK